MRAMRRLEARDREVSLRALDGVSENTVDILGVTLPILTRDLALKRIDQLAASSSPARVLYINAHTLNLAAADASFARVLGESHLLLNDGVGISLAARLQGRRMPANLNGSDFNPLILRRATERGWRVYFVGGRPGIAATAAMKLGEAIPGLTVVGTSRGYLDHATSVEVTRKIRDAAADLVMVGFGSPLQERWLERHLEATGARVGVAVGGFFDFASGAVPRAPSWMNRAGFEWLYRLAVEPRRLWRRYLIGNPQFVARVIAARARSR